LETDIARRDFDGPLVEGDGFVRRAVSAHQLGEENDRCDVVFIQRQHLVRGIFGLFQFLCLHLQFGKQHEQPGAVGVSLNLFLNESQCFSRLFLCFVHLDNSTDRFERIRITNQGLPEHHFRIRRALLRHPQFSHLQVIEGTLRRDPLQIHQIRFGAHRVAEIHPRSCMIEISFSGIRRMLFQLVAQILQVLPVSLRGGDFRQRQPGFGEVRAKTNSFSPLALGLLIVALLNECKAQLIVAHGIVRSAPEGGLQRG
jgi:hypothetical protein